MHYLKVTRFDSFETALAALDRMERKVYIKIYLHLISTMKTNHINPQSGMSEVEIYKNQEGT